MEFFFILHFIFIKIFYLFLTWLNGTHESNEKYLGVSAYGSDKQSLLSDQCFWYSKNTSLTEVSSFY